MSAVSVKTQLGRDGHYAVVIVGGGPVGVGLAIDLAQRGVSCAVVEANSELHDFPKGQLLTARTLEHFAAWGCEAEIRAARLLPPGQRLGSITTYQTLFSDHRYVMRRPVHALEGLYAQAPERLPQYLTEQVMRRRLAELPEAELMLGTTVTDIESTAQDVRVGIAATDASAGAFYSWASRESRGSEGRATRRAVPDAPAHSERVLHADYVVGCDGARSIVRARAALARTDGGEPVRMVLIVFRSPELRRRLEELPPATTYRVLAPELDGWWQFFGRIDADGGFFFHAPIEPDVEVDAQFAADLVRRSAGIPLELDIVHARAWDGRIRRATAYRADRLLIAGDAAHQHPPYGGYGLNTGLEDATNLGWKLAAVTAGWGGDALLDSYTSEREPVAAAVGSLIASSIGADAEFLRASDPTGDEVGFTAAWRELAEAPSILDVQREPHYEGSPIVSPVPGGPGVGLEHPDSLAARPGHHLSAQALSTGEPVSCVLGPGLTLIALDGDPASGEAFAEAAARCGVPLDIITDTDQGERAAWAARLILVRPDQYVAWSGQEMPQHPAEILARTVGLALAPHQ